MTTTADRLALLVGPVAEDLDVEVYDIEDSSGTLRVLLDRPGGVDIDTLTEASRRISRSMDEDGTFSATSMLEVSSPGLERKLRTPDHFAGAVGEHVKIKLRPGIDDRRLDGVLSAATEDTITVVPVGRTSDGTPPDGSASRTVSVADITSAHTVFVWEATPKPGMQSKSKPAKSKPDKSEPARPEPEGRPTATPAGRSPSGDAAPADADPPEDPDRTDETEATT